MILLDTHIWLWWLLGDGSLSDTERDELDRLAARRELSISWATLLETEILERKGRITLLPDLEGWFRKAADPDFISILPVDTRLIITQRGLPEDFHADPADRLIAATSILSGYPLATHDRKIRESGAYEIWGVEGSGASQNNGRSISQLKASKVPL